MPVFHITGSAYYASGFDMHVIADDANQARDIVQDLIWRGAHEPPNVLDGVPELQEVCIECVEKEE